MNWADYQQRTLEDVLMPHQGELESIQDESQRFIHASSIILADSKRRVDELIQRVMSAGQLEHRLIVVGGIVINQDDKGPSYFAVRSFDHFDGHTQVSELHEFQDYSAKAMFDAEQGA